MKISNKYLTSIKVRVLHEELGLATKIGKKFTHWKTPKNPSDRLISVLKEIFPYIDELSFNKSCRIFDEGDKTIISW